MIGCSAVGSDSFVGLQGPGESADGRTLFKPADEVIFKHVPTSRPGTTSVVMLLHGSDAIVVRRADSL